MVNNPIHFVFTNVLAECGRRSVCLDLKEIYFEILF